MKSSDIDGSAIEILDPELDQCQQNYQLASRYDREKIYEEIWSEPIQYVAKRYGLSDVRLAKVCRKLNIPRPGRDYWPLKQLASLLQEDLGFRNSELKKLPKTNILPTELCRGIVTSHG